VPSPVPATKPAPAATRGTSANGGPPGATTDRERRRALAWRLAPVAVAALISIAYLIVEPRTVDYAAGLYRTFLFGEEGFALWNGNWFSGHHVLSYSVLFPPLGWLLGSSVVGALSAVAAAALFEALARRQWGDSARWGALWFGAAATAPLWSGRIPFLLGMALGMAALLALQRARPKLAVLLALLCGLASPVAGAFLGLVGVAHGLVSLRERWRVALALLAAGIGPVVLISLAFSSDGPEPFVLSAFWPLPLLAIGFAILLPREERTLRIAALLYALACCAAYLIDSPMGGNAARFGAFAGGPVLLCALLARGRPLARAPLAAAVVVVAGLAFIQWSPPVRDVIKAFEDPSVDAAYYEPLNEFLDRAEAGPARVEIPFTRSHWEAYEVGRRHPLARGWLRQADVEHNGIFYGGVLDSLTYGAWLSEHGVRWVALPDAKPDYSAYDERALIEAGLPYLRLAWRSEHWRVYEVTLPSPLVVQSGRASFEVTSLGLQDVGLHVTTPGEATVRVTWSQYWKPSRGCVERDGEWTRVIADEAGPLRLTIDFSPARVVSRGRRCA
jgi:hypothetical protein